MDVVEVEEGIRREVDLELLDRHGRMKATCSSTVRPSNSLQRKVKPIGVVVDIGTSGGPHSSPPKRKSEFEVERRRDRSSSTSNDEIQTLQSLLLSQNRIGPGYAHFDALGVGFACDATKVRERSVDERADGEVMEEGGCSVDGFEGCREGGKDDVGGRDEIDEVLEGEHRGLRATLRDSAKVVEDERASLSLGKDASSIHVEG